MIHRKSKIGYWGVNVNWERNGIIVLTGDDYDAQARAVLSVDQAEEMIQEIQKKIERIKENQGEGQGAD